MIYFFSADKSTKNTASQKITCCIFTKFKSENYFLCFIYLVVRASLITPFQLRPKPKSYTLPSLSLWHSMSKGTSSNCCSTVFMFAGIWVGSKAEGSTFPERISKSACSEVPKLSSIPSTIGSNSWNTIGRETVIDTITGLPFIFSLVSKILYKSVILDALTVFPL